MPDLIDAEVSQEAVQQRVRAWCAAVSGLETIFSHPGAPRPVPPYAMLNIISAARVRRLGPVYYEDVEIGPEDGEGEPEQRVVETRAEEWNWTVSVHLYGLAALDHARRLVNSFGVGSVGVDHLWPLHLAETSMVRRVPDLVENRWEERANFDLTLHGVVLDGYLADVAETGEITIVRRQIGQAPGGETSFEFEPPS